MADDANEPSRQPLDSKSEDTLIARSRLVRELRDLGLESGNAVMVHCRMSALGHVIGGAESIVHALLEVVGPDGTLMAYTGWQDAPPDNLDALDEMARRAYIEEHPPYDSRVALSSRAHGRVAEALRTWPGSHHSGHPEAGVAAVGPLAEALTAEHPYDDAYGVGTPYARLIKAGGRVVMLGAPLDTVTLVHHAEAIANVRGKRRVGYAIPILAENTGERVWRTFSDIDTSNGAFPYKRVLSEESYIKHIARSALLAGAAKEGTVGNGAAYLFDARRLTEHAVGWIEAKFSSQNYGFL